MEKNVIQRLTDYALLGRMDKPVGSLLLLWPTFAAVWIAGKGRPQALVLFVLVLGVFLMRTAGCILNDLADRKFDGKVQRTQYRPLVAGKVTAKEALIVCGVLLLLAFFLVLLLNILSILLALVAVVLAALYPFMKRVTSLPQLVLGLAFSWGVPMAFAAQTGRVPAVAWWLYAIAVIWTVAYDTMYAMADRLDDIQIGIKSTAVLFGQADRSIIGLLQLVVWLLLFKLGQLLSLNAWYYASVFSLLSFFAYQHYLIRNREPQRCIQAFTNNSWAWAMIVFGIILNYCS